MTVANEWHQFWAANQQLPLVAVNGPETLESVTPYCFRLDLLKGLPVPGRLLSQADEAAEALISGNNVPAHIYVRVSFYDEVNAAFFGRTWESESVAISLPIEGGTVDVSLDAASYFLSRVQDTSALAVIEVVAQVSCTTSAASCFPAEVHPNDGKLSCALGWCAVPVFLGPTAAAATAEAEGAEGSATIYAGTPRILPGLHLPLAEAPLAQHALPGCRLSHTLFIHEPLLSLTELLPENMLVGEATPIPGLSTTSLATNPSIMPNRPFFMDQLRIRIENTSLAAFEAQFLANVTRSILQEHPESELPVPNPADGGGGVAATSLVSIDARKINVAVHNGLRRVGAGHVAHLTPVGAMPGRGTAAAAAASEASTVLASAAQAELAFQGILEISELIDDPMFALTFEVVYAVRLPLLRPKQKHSKKVQKALRSVASASNMPTDYVQEYVLRWSSFAPFSDSNGDVRVGPTAHVVALEAGPRPNTRGALVYAGGQNLEMKDMATPGLLEAHFVLSPHAGEQEDETGSGRVNHDPSRLLRSLRGSMLIGGNATGSFPTSPVSATSSFNRRSPTRGTSRPPPSAPSAASTAPRGRDGAPPPQLLAHPSSSATTAPGELSRQSSDPTSSSSGKPGLSVSWRAEPALVLSDEPMVDAAGNADAANSGDFDDLLVEAPLKQQGEALMAHATLAARRNLVTLAQLPRAGRAVLHKAGFPSLVKRMPGSLSEGPTVSPGPCRYTPSLEQRDLCQGNEVCFQIMAYAAAATTPGLRATVVAPMKALVVSFRFYRFANYTSPRLGLSAPKFTAEGGQLPRVVTVPGAVGQRRPGLDVRFMVDPMALGGGDNEHVRFTQYLASSTLQIDIWDGDSLAHVGTAELELVHLLRGGNRAIGDTVELPVAAVSPATAGILARGALTAGAAGSVARGSLYLAIANIGHPVPVPSASARLTPPGIACRVLVPVAGEAPATSGNSGAVVPVVARLAEADPELAVALHRSHPDRFDAEAETKARRLATARARMGIKAAAPPAVRLGDASSGTGFGASLPPALPVATARDLELVESYRARRKRETIHRLLRQAVTASHTIRPAFGCAEYIEFPIRNPYAREVALTVRMPEDKRLHLITDAAEWAALATMAGATTPIESGMFEERDGATVLFLRPHEQVIVPFKYQSFEVAPCVPGEVVPASRPMRSEAQPDISATTSLPAHVASVAFVGADRRAVAELRLVVEPRSHPVDRVLRFWCAQNTVLKETLRIPAKGRSDASNMPEYSVSASDPNVVASLAGGHGRGPCDVFIKAPCGSAPDTTSFCVAVYGDRRRLIPLLTWQFHVHSVERVALTGVLGQATQASVALHGLPHTRRVKCISSDPSQLELVPADAFVLVGGAVQDIGLILRPSRTGQLVLGVNIVDADTQALVGAWQVSASVVPPSLSKAFELIVPLNSEVRRRVAYRNSHLETRTFSVATDRPDIVNVRQSKMTIDAAKSHYISLGFSTRENPCRDEALVFIRDAESGTTEETFVLRITWA